MDELYWATKFTKPTIAQTWEEITIFRIILYSLISGGVDIEVTKNTKIWKSWKFPILPSYESYNSVYS